MSSITKEVNNIISWQLIDSLAGLKAIKPQWQAIVDDTPDLSPFSSPAWLLTWYKIYWQQEWQLNTFAGYIDGELVALLPCYIQNVKQFPYLKILYPLGQGEPEEEEISSEYCDVIISTPHVEDVLLALQKKLRTLKVDQIKWNATLQKSLIQRLLDNTFENKAASTHTRYFVKSSQWSLQSLSKNTRSRYKRSINQLNKINAKFYWVEPEECESHINLLIEYHQNLWLSRGQKGAFYHSNFNDFHKAYRTKGSVSMSAISVNNKPIAINYYFDDKESLYFYQSGWDNMNYSNFSLGLSLHLWSIENCNKQYYDFMMGNLKDSYKEKFGVLQEPMMNINLILSPRKVLFHKVLNKILCISQLLFNLSNKTR